MAIVERNVSRREFLRIVPAATAAAALAFAGCAEPSSPSYIEPTPTPTPTFSPESAIAPKDRLAVLMREPIDLPQAARQAFEAVTNAYSASRRPDNRFQRLRQVAFSPTTTQQLIDRAKAGNLFIMLYHSAVVAEFDQLRDFAALPKEKRNGILDVYAEGVVDGLAGVYNPAEYLAVAIEAGHLSSAPKDAIDKINQGRVARGVAKIYPTQDTGAFAPLLEGGEVSEKEVNLALGRLIALKIMQRFQKWIPVVNAQEDGFPVERFIAQVPDTLTHYIAHRDAIVPLRYKWERLADLLKQAGVPMVRIAVHFDGTPGLAGGFMIPQNSNYKEESIRLADSLAKGLAQRAKPYMPQYVNVPRPDFNSNPDQPYWMIDDLAFPEDFPAVREGKVDNVRGVTNRLLAAIRSEALETVGR